jgi:hypothetical protein
MKYPFLTLLISTTLFGCTQTQRQKQTQGAIKEDIPGEWVDSTGLLSPQQQHTLKSLEFYGQTKTVQDSFRNMLIRNMRDHQSAAGRSSLLHHDNGDFTFRRPYWELKQLAPDSVAYVRKTLNTTVRYLQQLRSISRDVARKLIETNDSGIVYSPGEVDELAGTLAQTESKMRNRAFVLDLESLVERGNLRRDDLVPIWDRVNSGEIQTPDDIVKTYGHNIVYIPCPQTVTDDSTCLAELLGKVLTSLPFYKSHTIESIRFVEMEEWPGRGYGPYTLIQLVVNGKRYSLSYSTLTLGYAITKRVHMEFLPSFLHTLARDFDGSLELHLVPSYCLGVALSMNTNIAGYYIYISKPVRIVKTYFPPGGLLQGELGWQGILYSNADKQQYVDNVIKVLNRPWSKAILDSIRERIKWYNVKPDNQLLLQFPATTDVIWEDELDNDKPSPYAPIIARLDKISGGRLKGISVAGKTKLHLTFHHHTYTTTLQQGDELDYGFIRALDQLQKSEDLGGRFYYVPIDFIDEGYTFIFLTTDEYATLHKTPYFTVQPLDRLAKTL